MTNRPQGADELLAAKHEADKQKQAFAEYAKGVAGGRPEEAGQEFRNHDHVPDQQNHLKDVENLRK